MTIWAYCSAVPDDEDIGEEIDIDIEGNPFELLAYRDELLAAIERGDAVTLAVDDPTAARATTTVTITPRFLRWMELWHLADDGPGLRSDGPSLGLVGVLVSVSASRP